MSLKEEFDADLKIDGQPAVLNTVTNEIDPETGETVITRKYVSWDLKKTKEVVERVAPAVPPVPVDKYTGPVELEGEFEYDEDASIEPGMMIAYQDEDEDGEECYFKGRVSKVMPRTVCIDVPGQKDLSVKNKNVLGTI